MVEEKQQKSEERIVRILARDIEGKMTVYSGLAKIKGVSWTLSNAACNLLGISKTKKIGALTDSEIEKISEFLKNPPIPEYLFNRRKDFETGENKHLLGSDLELKKEFDIKRLRKIRCYRGSRHALGLPSRGQRTKGNFRRNRKKGAGIKKK
ncbi:MAG TPA: 30S ribosomal protein S13 [Candidatus Nanoarchaeia archaeon]|nr:30S ribosomal protein S13 [Candidatus Nanoarchaeia archaeon]